MSKAIALQIKNLEKTFYQGGRTLTIFKDLNMSVNAGEITALVGQSGSGKSTLLHIAGLLDKPTSGQVMVGGRDTGMHSDKDRTLLRRNEIGFIYQFHHLLPEFTAVENVAMPQIIAGAKKVTAHAKAENLLKSMGLGDRLTHRPARLSGGEQQRVAIARALVNDPKVLLADEPTGNLDVETSDSVFNILLDQARQRGIGALIATHNLDLAQKMDRLFLMKGGELREV